MEHVTDTDIRHGITDIIKAWHGPTRWVPIREIKADWAGYGDVTPDRIDQILTGMFAARDLVLIPESNQKTLTDADRQAAIWAGGRYLHHATLPEYDR